MGPGAISWDPIATQGDRSQGPAPLLPKECLGWVIPSGTAAIIVDRRQRLRSILSNFVAQQWLAKIPDITVQNIKFTARLSEPIQLIVRPNVTKVRLWGLPSLVKDSSILKKFAHFGTFRPLALFSYHPCYSPPIAFSSPPDRPPICTRPVRELLELAHTLQSPCPHPP